MRPQQHTHICMYINDVPHALLFGRIYCILLSHLKSLLASMGDVGIRAEVVFVHHEFVERLDPLRIEQSMHKINASYQAKLGKL